MYIDGKSTIYAEKVIILFVTFIHTATKISNQNCQYSYERHNNVIVWIFNNQNNQYSYLLTNYNL